MFKLLVVFVLLFVLYGCGPQSSYVSVEQMEVSRNFGIKDEKILVDAIVQNMKKDSNLMNYFGIKVPTLLVGEIVNQTSEHLDTTSIVSSLKVAISSTGIVKILDRANKELLVEEQKLNQAGFTSAERATKIGKLWGAKFYLRGNLTSKVSYTKKTTNNYYKLVVSILDIETGQEIWIGESDVNKITK